MTDQTLGHAARELLRLHDVYVGLESSRDWLIRSAAMIACAECTVQLPAAIADRHAQVHPDTYKRWAQVEAALAGDISARSKLKSEVCMFSVELKMQLDRNARCAESDPQ